MQKNKKFAQRFLAYLIKRMRSHSSLYLFPFPEHINGNSGFPLHTFNCYETELVNIQLRRKNDLLSAARQKTDVSTWEDVVRF